LNGIAATTGSLSAILGTVASHAQLYVLLILIGALFLAGILLLGLFTFAISRRRRRKESPSPSPGIEGPI
jgi:hypothetical protein